jgi:hypothetical protein
MMQRNLKRLAAGLLLGLALAFGALGAGQLAQPAPAVACGLSNCGGGGGGG